MGRFRAREPAGSKYITRAGEQRLRHELDALWRGERPKVTLAVQAAAAQGDRSENAEYTYGKRRLREIDRRVRFLRKRLEGMVVVDVAAERGRRDARRVYFGAWVELENEAGERRWLRLVNPASSYLCSNDSRAHFGLGAVERVDRIEVVWPDGKTESFDGGEVDRPIELFRGKGPRWGKP